MILFASGLTIGAYMIVSLSLTSKIPSNLQFFLGFVLILGLIAHLATRILAPEADSVLLPTVVLLNGLGYVMISRLDVYSVHKSAPWQAAWTALGVGVYILTLKAVKRTRDLDRYRYIIAIIAAILLALPLVPHVGESIGGARLWIHIGNVTFQPIEIAKLLLVIFFASYFVEKRELLSIGTLRIGNRLFADPRSFGPILLAAIVSLMAMAIEHDVGFALLLFVLFISMLWIATGRFAYVFLGIAVFALGTWVGSHLLLQVNDRLVVWLDPWKYSSGGGFQPIQGIISLATGGLGGVGLGQGLTGLYVPVPQSDYIFVAFGEELGLFGSAAIIVAFLIIIGSGFRIAIAAKSDFAKLVAAGLTILIGFQSFFILAGIERILPLTGVTLPWVSYGGSSLVANYVLLALLMRISSESEERKLEDLLKE